MMGTPLRAVNSLGHAAEALGFASPAPEREASALAGLEALLGLVDDVDAALAADELVVAVTPAQGFQRVADFHRSGLRAAWSVNRTGLQFQKAKKRSAGSVAANPAHDAVQSGSHNPASH